MNIYNESVISLRKRYRCVLAIGIKKIGKRERGGGEKKERESLLRAQQCVRVQSSLKIV